MQQGHDRLEPLPQQDISLEGGCLPGQAIQPGTTATAAVRREQLPQQLQQQQRQRQSLDTPQLAEQPQLQLPQPVQQSSLLFRTTASKQGLASDTAPAYQQQRFDIGLGNTNLLQQQQQFMGAGGAAQLVPQLAGQGVSGPSALQGQTGCGFRGGAAAGWPSASGIGAAAAAAVDGQLGLAIEQPHVQQQQQQGNEQPRLQAEDLEDSLLTITPSLDLLSLLNEPADSDAPGAADATLAQALNVQLPQQQQQQQQQGQDLQQQQALVYQQQCNLTEQADYHHQQQQQQCLQQRQDSSPLLQQQPQQVPEQRQDSAPLLQLASSCMNHHQQQPVHLLQMLQAKQQLQQPASAFGAAKESAFAAVQVMDSSSSVGCSRPLTAERSSSINVSRTVTGELPVLPPGFDASKQQALADANAAAAAAAAAVDTGSPHDVKQYQHLMPREQQQQQDLVVLRHTRQITCKTYLKRLNVTQYMSDHLLPRMEGSLRVSSQKQQAAAAGGPASSSVSSRSAAGGSSSSAAELYGASAAAAAVSDDDYDPSSGKGAAGKAAGSHKGSSGSSSQRSYEMLFKVQVKLVDAMGQIWPVTYEGVMCAGQRHLRLTCGWSEFIKAKRLSIGDAITFEQRGGNRTALAVAITRAGLEVEEAWAGALPEDDQVKVLVGALRDGSNSPVTAAVHSPAAAAAAAAAAGGNAAAAAAVAVSVGKRSGSAGRRSGSGGSGRKPARPQAAAAATRRAQLKKHDRQTPLKRSRARGTAGDDYDWDDRDWEGDDAGSSGSGAQVDVAVPACLASYSRAGSALLPHEFAAAAGAANRESSDMLRVASSDPWDAAAAAASVGSGQQLQQLAGSGPVLGRPRSFTKRQSLNLNLNLNGMGCPQTSAPAGVSSMMLSPKLASAAGRAVMSGQEGPWHPAQQQQQQQPWQHQEQQLQWQRQELPRQSWQQQQQELQPPALSSWDTYPAAAADAAAQGGVERPADVVPQQRRYNRQVSHPVARRELLAVQQDIADASNPAVQQQQQRQAMQMPSGYGGVIKEELEFGAAAAGLSGRSRLSAAMSLQQYQQQHDDMLRPAASVPVLSPAAAAVAAAGSRSMPGWLVSTGFVGGGPADRFDSSYQRPQQQQRQMPPYSQGSQLTRQQDNVNPVGAACAVDTSLYAGRQQYQQQGYSTVPDSPAQYALPQHFQQQQQQQWSLLNQHKLEREEVVDPRGLMHPQLAPPTPKSLQQQQQQQQQQLVGMPGGPQSMGLQAYDRPMQMPMQQQQQQMPPPFSQPLVQPPLAQQLVQQQQQQRYELQQAAAAPVMAAAPAQNEWVEPAEESNPFIQHQQQRQLDAPDPDQISVGAMESDMLVDTLLQLLAEPSVNMQQAPSLPLAISMQMASLTQEQHQELHQALQQEQQQRQQQQQMQAQQQQQLGQHGQVDAAGQAQQLQEWEHQAMHQQAAQPQLQPQPPLPLQLLQQWQQQQQQHSQPPLPWQASAPRLAPPTLLPPEAVAAASQQLLGAGGSMYEASAAFGQQRQLGTGFPRQGQYSDHDSTM